MSNSKRARRHSPEKVVPITLLEDKRKDADPLRLEAATARAGAVAKFRDLADRMERGELDGARAQWREGLHRIEVVEVVHATETSPGRVQLIGVEIDSQERPENPDEPHYTEES